MALPTVSLLPSVLLIAGLSAAVALSPVNASTERGAKASFSELDTNSDGVLSQAEIAARATARFAAADTNGDGFLTSGEMIAAAKSRDSNRLERRVARMISRQDTNDDGRLSLEELAPTQERMAERFARADANDDGVLSAEEFEASAKGMRRGQKNRADRSE